MIYSKPSCYNKIIDQEFISNGVQTFKGIRNNNTEISIDANSIQDHKSV